jgi:PAS domain-containing protein
MWTYLTTPFILVHEGVEVREIDPWIEQDEVWRVLRARFPKGMATHSSVEDFYFGSEDLLLRRHDYEVEIIGGSPAAQLVYDYIHADGIRMPSKRRAHPRGDDGRPIKDVVGVAIDINNLSYSY